MTKEINWRDYSFNPDDAAEMIQEEIDNLLKGQDPEYLSDADYAEYDSLQTALWRAQDAAEEQAASLIDYDPYFDNGLSCSDFCYLITAHKGGSFLS